MKAPRDQIVIPGPIDEATLPPLIAGALGLELCNTIARRYTKAPVDYLPDYPALLHWAVNARALDVATGAELARLAASRPSSAARALAAAHELRAAIHTTFLAVVEHGAPNADALALLDGHVRGAFAARRLAATSSGAAWQWTDANPFMRPLWPVALSAASLLTSAEIARVRECAGRADGCGWLFLDTGRGSGRRWCSMELCGNRSKVRRHYQRAQHP
jgi:predicted RNA-binding Zn ribbon-like protein